MSANNGRADSGPGGEFDGLDGVGDELEILGDEVSGGRSGQPRNTTPTPADPGDQGAPSGDEPTGLLQELGYENEEEATKAWRNLRTYTSETKDENTRMREENAALKAKLAAQETGFARMSPNAQEALREQPQDPMSQLAEDYHIPRELLTPAIEAVAEARLVALLKPLYDATQVDEKMAQQYGAEYVKAKPRIEKFVASNPHVQQIVQTARERGMPELAAEYALGAYREALASATHNGITHAAGSAESMQARGRTSGTPLQSREHTRELLAKRQSGTDIDFNEAIRRANNGDDRLIDAHFAQDLPSEEHLEKVFRGHI